MARPQTDFTQAKVAACGWPHHWSPPDPRYVETGFSDVHPRLHMLFDTGGIFHHVGVRIAGSRRADVDLKVINIGNWKLDLEVINYIYYQLSIKIGNWMSFGNPATP